MQKVQEHKKHFLRVMLLISTKLRSPRRQDFFEIVGSDHLSKFFLNNTTKKPWAAQPLHCPPHISPKRRDKLRASSPLELLGFPVVFKCGANSLSRASKDNNGETALKHCSVLFMKHVLPRLHKPTTPRAKGCPISFSGILAGLCCFLVTQPHQQTTKNNVSHIQCQTKKRLQIAGLALSSPQ